MSSSSPHQYPRIYLSPPHMSGRERVYLDEAFSNNWISPVGPQVDAFEQALAKRIGISHVVALSSGTAAIHLALRSLGLQRGDEVFCSTLTFAGSVNPILYEGGCPVFIDSDLKSWNMDPNLLEDELDRCRKRAKLPRAVIVVDLYGQCADLPAIKGICQRFDVPLIEDAAEALGATSGERSAGTFGWANIFSFNGNKIITTGGGGALATEDASLAATAKHLSQQARDPAPHYQHSKVGFNYRLSNLLAAVGIAQLEVLDDWIAARRKNFNFYLKLLGRIPGIQFMPDPGYGLSTRWLTCMQVDPNKFGATREDIRQHLERENIEARPVWKPMHLQPIFSGFRCVGGKISERLFENGLCLPSGSNLSVNDLDRVVNAIVSIHKSCVGESQKLEVSAVVMPIS